VIRFGGLLPLGLQAQTAAQLRSSCTVAFSPVGAEPVIRVVQNWYG
jgi:hypothetical protein